MPKTLAEGSAGVPEKIPAQINRLLNTINDLAISSRVANNERALVEGALETIMEAFTAQYGALCLNRDREVTFEVERGQCPLALTQHELGVSITRGFRGVRDVLVRFLTADPDRPGPLWDPQGHQPVGMEDQGLVLVSLAMPDMLQGALLLDAPAGRRYQPAEMESLRLIGQVLSAGLWRLRLVDELDSVSRKLAAQNERLQQNATTDSLTGLSNRPVFLEEIQRLVSKAPQDPLSLLLIDVDHFSSINKTYGHHFGDKLLARVADAIRQGTRGRDIAARCGGDEFGVLLPSTGGTGAVVVAERLREAISAMSFADNKDSWYATVSIGVACLSDSVATSDQLIAKSEQSLLQAKGIGGNQIMFDWDEVLNKLAES
ncbi:MAG: GGDEF domain-containing protein [Armatimonadota bacterium]